MFLLLFCIQGICLDIVCPFTAVMVAGQCVNLVTKVAGASFQYRLDFVFENKNQQLPIFNELLDETSTYLLLDGSDKVSSMCGSRVISSNVEEGTLKLKAIIGKNIESPTPLKSSLDEMKKKIISLNEINAAQNKGYIISLGQSGFDMLNTTVTRFIQYPYDTYYCTDSIAITEHQFCRQVVARNFTFKIDTDLDNDTSVYVNGAWFYDHEVLFAGGTVGDLVVYICEDVYVRKMLLKKECTETALCSASHILRTKRSAIVFVAFMFIYGIPLS